MRIKNVYKRTAALFFLMVAALWPVADAWGQAVKGDKYVKEIRVSNFTVGLVGEGADDSNIEDAFDGNYDGTWWEANSAGVKTIVISFDVPTYIHSIDLMGGGNDAKTA